MPSVPPQPLDDDAADAPDESLPEGRVAIRRVTDRCFFEAEEAVHGPDGSLEGYIVEGFLIPIEEIAETRPMHDDDAACNT